MYLNKYYVEMVITRRGNGSFTQFEIAMLERIRMIFNSTFANMTRKQTANKKYISSIDYKSNGILGFHLETEFAIRNTNRIGNALRMFSIIASQHGCSVYVNNQRLMKAA